MLWRAKRPLQNLKISMSETRAPAATVIVSTYNKPHYLVRTLEGLAQQTFPDFEIVIADDGSDAVSRDIADRWIAESPLVISRVWQEDNGFRKTKILNKALAAARADYLIFTDGDCIPFPDFVELHLKHRAHGTFLSAGAIRLNDAITDAVLAGRVPAGEIRDRKTLVSHGFRAELKQRRMFAPKNVRTLLDAVLPIKKTFNGLNSSCWKADALLVGGFNEEMGYGSEDVEFGLRLQAAGVRPVRVRHRIRAFHLDHDKPYATPEEINRNYRIKEATRRSLARPARASAPKTSNP
jgi:glycosyltransferase involved in cell wall biosynthesis